jgi:hypothetical protein
MRAARLAGAWIVAGDRMGMTAEEAAGEVKLVGAVHPLESCRVRFIGHA